MTRGGPLGLPVLTIYAEPVADGYTLHVRRHGSPERAGGSTPAEILAVALLACSARGKGGVVDVAEAVDEVRAAAPGICAVGKSACSGHLRIVPSDEDGGA